MDQIQGVLASGRHKREVAVVRLLNLRRDRVASERLGGHHERCTPGDFRSPWRSSARRHEQKAQSPVPSRCMPMGGIAV